MALPNKKVVNNVGESTVARVVSDSSSPLKFEVAFPDGKKGVLPAAGVTNELLVAKRLKKILKKNNLIHVKLVGKDGDRWIVAGNAKTNTPVESIKKGQQLNGYVTAIDGNGQAVIEYYPESKVVVNGCKNVEIDDLITVVVTSLKPELTGKFVESVEQEVSDDEDDDVSEADDSGESENESDADMEAVGAEDIIHDSVENALSLLKDGGNLWAAEAMISSKLKQIKKDKKEANKNEQEEKRARKKSESEQVEEDVEEKNEASRILHKEKILSGIEKSKDLFNDEDYDRLIVSNPNSAEAWISYMAYQAQNGNVDEARKIAENALNTIDSREEQERLNVYTAYLSLEVTSGDENSLKEIFRRATSAHDQLEVYKRLANIYTTTNKNEELDKLYQVMIKKFGQHHREVYVLYGGFLYNDNRQEDGRELMKKAMNSLPKKHRTFLL